MVLAIPRAPSKITMPKMTPSRKAPSVSRDPDRWLDAKRLSQYIPFSPQAIYRRVHEGTIPFFRVGRRVLFDKRAIDKWLEREKRGSQGSQGSQTIPKSA
jgi:excisionase family DNA binding protein